MTMPALTPPARVHARYVRPLAVPDLARELVEAVRQLHGLTGWQTTVKLCPTVTDARGRPTWCRVDVEPGARRALVLVADPSRSPRPGDAARALARAVERELGRLIPHTGSKVRR